MSDNDDDDDDDDDDGVTYRIKTTVYWLKLAH